MKTVFSALIGSMCLAGIAIPAAATNITYTGVQNVGSITATYSITTDGVIGAADSSDIKAFDVTLSDASVSREYSNLNASAFGDFIASPKILSAYNGLDLRTDINPFQYVNLYFDSSFTAAQIIDTSVAENDSALNFVPNYYGFASVAAVPETATWAMMIMGVGAIGGMMRRNYRKSEEKFTAKVRGLAAA